MGLDNGFCVKSNRRQLCKNDLPSGIIYPFREEIEDNNKYDEFEIIYWRKNWGLRDAIINYFDDKNACGVYEIDTPEQIDSIIQIILSFLDKDIWDEEGRSIWDFKDMKFTLHSDIVNLLLMKEWIKTHKDIYIEFYDSY